jgi:hypothetical protein
MTIHQDGPFGRVISGDDNHADSLPFAIVGGNENRCEPHPAYEAMLERIRTGKATIDGMEIKANVESGGLQITISGTDHSASGSENG